MRENGKDSGAELLSESCMECTVSMRQVDERFICPNAESDDRHKRHYLCGNCAAENVLLLCLVCGAVLVSPPDAFIAVDGGSREDDPEEK